MNYRVPPVHPGSRLHRPKLDAGSGNEKAEQEQQQYRRRQHQGQSKIDGAAGWWMHPTLRVTRRLQAAPLRNRFKG